MDAYKSFRTSTARTGRKHKKRVMDDVHEGRQEAIIKFLDSHQIFDYSIIELRRHVNFSYNVTAYEVEQLVYLGRVIVTRRIKGRGANSTPMFQLREWLTPERDAERMVLYREHLKPRDLINE